MTIKSSIRFGLLSGAAFAMSVVAPPEYSIATAQQVSLEEIVVTARRRSESLQDIPLAISAFTAQDIEDAGIQGLDDLAMQTTGMDFNPRQGGGRLVGRINSVIRLRGVFSSEADHLQPTSLFVDGIYVLGTAASVGLQDLERVEVIKGPQSAFFGRNTFAGAVNYITKTPDLNEYETKVDVSLASYNKYDGNILTSGPIIPGKLAYQLNARMYHAGGEWTATDGGKMGQESSAFVSGVLYGEPSDNLSFKFRAYYQKDDDGSPVAGVIRGRFADTCTGTSIERFNFEGTAKETFFPTEYICGDVPKFGYFEQPDPNHPFAGPFYPLHGPGFQNGPRTLLSHETSLTVPLYNTPRLFINSAFGGAEFGPQPFALQEFLLGDAASEYLGKRVPDIDGYGLVREQIRFALNSDYEFDNGYAISFLAGYNDMRLNALWDYDGTDDPVWHAVVPKVGVDWSVEARLSSPEENRFRWLLGATWYDQEFFQGTGSGGLFLTSCLFNCTTTGPALLSLPPTGGNLAEVWGVFGSASYDITDEITLDVETRYLQDQRTVSESGFSFTDTFKQFTPRVILRYQPSDDTTIYIQGSRGTLPGNTNAIITTCSEDDFLVPYVNPITGEPNQFDSECQQIRNQTLPEDFNEATPSQKMTAYEIGWKQTLMEGRARFNLTGWFYEWKNRPFGQSIIWIRDSELPQDRDRIPNDFPNNQGISVPGSQKLWGVEFESGMTLSENLDAQLNVSWNDNKFTEFKNVGFGRTTGVNNFKGLKIFRYPDWQANLATTYTDQFNSDWDWYGRVDVIYQGKYWADNINLARGPDWMLTNARVGLTREDLRIEFFVRNLFQTRAWRSVTTQSDITSAAFDFNSIRGVGVSPQEKRTFGVRTNLTF